MANVSIDDMRDVINVSSAAVPDAKVLKIVKRAEVTLELETAEKANSSSRPELRYENWRPSRDLNQDG